MTMNLLKSIITTLTILFSSIISADSYRHVEFGESMTYQAKDFVTNSTSSDSFNIAIPSNATSWVQGTAGTIQISPAPSFPLHIVISITNTTQNTSNNLHIYVPTPQRTDADFPLAEIPSTSDYAVTDRTPIRINIVPTSSSALYSYCDDFLPSATAIAESLDSCEDLTGTIQGAQTQYEANEIVIQQCYDDEEADSSYQEDADSCSSLPTEEATQECYDNPDQDTASATSSVSYSALTGTMTNAFDYASINDSTDISIQYDIAKNQSNGYFEYENIIRATAVCRAFSKKEMSSTSSPTPQSPILPSDMDNIANSIYSSALNTVLTNILPGAQTVNLSPSVYNVRSLAEIIAIYDTDRKEINTLACDFVNDTNAGVATADIIMSNTLYSQNSSAWDSLISQIKSSYNDPATTEIWTALCRPTTINVPLLSPEGQGFSASKTLYAIGISSIPQTKSDGTYDKGYLNPVQHQVSDDNKSQFAILSPNGTAYISSGIQNQPNNFYYDDNPEQLEALLLDKLSDSISPNNIETILTNSGNLSSSLSLKGYVLKSNSGSDVVSDSTPTATLETNLYKDKYIRSAHTTTDSGWNDNILRQNFLSSAVQSTKTLLDLYNEGFNWDEKACTSSGDTNCKFSISMFSIGAGCGGAPHPRLTSSFTAAR